MGTSSGIVLDFFTNQPVWDANIFLYTTSGKSMYSSSISDPVGTFFINTPDNQQFDVLYVPFKEGYVGYSTMVSNRESFISLYLREDSQILNISGSKSLNLYNSTLVTGQKVNDVKASSLYIYIATTGGLDILDINTLQNIGFILYPEGISCIVLNKNYCTGTNILMGTANSGVLQYTILNTDTKNLTNLVTTKWSANNGRLNSNTVTCIDQTINNSYLIGTNSGIDYYTSSGVRYKHEYGINLNTTCCKISEFDDLYYSPEGSGVYIKYGPVTSDWNTNDYIVQSSGMGINPFPLLSNYINDIDLKSVSGSNSVFIASISGLVYYDENRLDLDLTASGAKLIRNYP